MKRIILITLSILLLITSGVVAVQPSRISLPIVASALSTPQLITVLECQCGFSNSAVGPDGKIYTIAQRFDRGGKLYVYVYEGTSLREVTDPGMVGPVPTSNNAPAFGLPVQKNGPGSILFTSSPNPEMVIIAPARPVGVTEGDYNLMMYRVPFSMLQTTQPVR